MDAAIIEREAMQLPEGLKEAWIREADDRMRAFRNGDIEAVNGPEAMAELKARIAG